MIDRPIPRLICAFCWTMAVVGASNAQPLQAEETRSERRARVEQMDAAQKAELRRAQDRFARLDDAEQQRLHDLHDRIAAHPNSAALLDVMERYCEWANTLSPSERAELRELPPRERIEKIKELRAEHARRRQFGPPGLRGFYWGDRIRKLSLQEREGMTRWLDQYMAENAPKLIEALPSQQQKRLREEWEQAADDPTRRRIVFMQTWALWHAAHPGEWAPLGDEAFKRLRSQLSPDARGWLEKTPPEAHRRILDGLIGAFLFIQSTEQLSEYLQNEATAREREFLTSLSPAETRQQLWWRYLHWKWPDVFPRPPEFRRGRGPLHGGFRPGPDGPPGPRRRFDRMERPPPSGSKVPPEGPPKSTEGSHGPRP
jgi:hypothetical protein